MKNQSKSKLQTTAPNHMAGRSANGPRLGHLGVIKTSAPPIYRPHPPMQPKMVSVSQPSALPPAPPVYRPGLVLNAVQPRKTQGAAPMLQPTMGISTTPPVGVQTSASVVQAKGNKCIVCGHKHGSSKCTVVTAMDAKGKAISWCGCKSHSSKWDSGSKANPGSGKRARMLAAR